MHESVRQNHFGFFVIGGNRNLARGTSDLAFAMNGCWILLLLTGVLIGNDVMLSYLPLNEEVTEVKCWDTDFPPEFMQTV